MAQALAPKYVRKPGDTRRAFGFAGNRLLLRELNFLRKARASQARAIRKARAVDEATQATRQARAIVLKILAGDEATLHCPHRALRLAVAARDLHLKVRRSGHSVPTPLAGEWQSFFTPAASRQLLAWLGHLNVATVQLSVSHMRKRCITIYRTCGRKGNKPMGYWISAQSRQHWTNANRVNGCGGSRGRSY